MGDVESTLPPLIQQPVQLVEHKPHRLEPVPHLHRWDLRYAQMGPMLRSGLPWLATDDKSGTETEDP